ncbi:MAG TPA: hypothetical protein VMH27_22260 [Puia sp.]|nr:hypothetical protein [Puia sp.]
MKIIYFFSAILFASTRLEAQLSVDREPHHKVLLQNDYIRLLEGNIPAKDTTAAHVHAANSVVVFLSHSTFGIRVAGDKPVIATVSPGDVRFVAYGDKPVNHVVWDEDGPPLRFYVVELAIGRQVRDTSIEVTGHQPYPPARAHSAHLLILPDSRYRFYPPDQPVDWSEPGRCIWLEIY